MRTRSHSPAPSGPRLSQIAFDTPSRPKSCTSPARRSVRTSSPASPSCAPGLGREVRDRARMSERVRRLQVDEVRDRGQRVVDGVADEDDGERRLALDHGVPRHDRVETAEDRVGLAHERARHSAGSNCLPARFARERLRRRRPRRRDARPRRTPRAARPAPRAESRSPCELARPPAPVPLLVRAAQRVQHLVRQVELLRRARVRAARAGRPCPSTSRWPDSANSSPTRKRCERRIARADHPQRRRPPPRSPRSSPSYFVDFNAMSSPNHFACSCASVWQPTLMRSAV